VLNHAKLGGVGGGGGDPKSHHSIGEGKYKPKLEIPGDQKGDSN